MAKKNPKPNPNYKGPTRRNSDGTYEKGSGPGPKEFDPNDPRDSKRGFLSGRGENAGRRIQLYSQSPKGIKVRDIRSIRLARRLILAFPWLEKPDFALVKTYAQVAILTDECYALIRQQGIVRKDGSPHRFLAEFRNLARTSADLAGRLGLSPRDRALMKSLNTTGALERIDVKRINELIEARNRTKVPTLSNQEEVIENNNGDEGNSGGDQQSGK